MEHVMAKGYWIGRLDVNDPEAFKAYQAANAAPLKQFGARFLARGGKCDCVEGVKRARNVIVEFPSYEAALACYRSPEYQRAIALRKPAATADFVLVEGYDGPQP
jgi:uncharacterized protein (DUF1330 family)